MNTKRATDITLALVGLIVTTPLIMLAMIGIVMCSPGSPVFAQERVGLYGRRFTMQAADHEGQRPRATRNAGAKRTELPAPSSR